MRVIRLRWAALVAGVAIALGSVVALGQQPAPALILASAADLAGWVCVTDPPSHLADVVTARPDGVIGVTGTPTGYLATKASYGNYRIHAEWRWPGKPGNGGVLLHISPGPKDRQWPLSFQVQLKNTAVGDLLPMAGATFGEPLSTPPGAKTPQLNHAAPDSERPAGEWNTCDIVCRDDTIEVVINGVLQNRVTRCSLREGHVGFQLEGTPFELRNVSVTPLR
jgi:hypothetical protein